MSNYLGYSKIIFIGRIVRTPEIKNSGNKSRAVYNVAVNNVSGDGTTYFRCVSFDKQSEIVMKLFDKGDLVHIEGRFETRIYSDPCEGYDHRYDQVITSDIRLLNKVNKKGGENACDANDGAYTNMVSSETIVPGSSSGIEPSEDTHGNVDNEPKILINEVTE